MTLRATVEIVPHGDETQARKLFRLNIHNKGLVRNEGFGHEICKYRAELQRLELKAAVLGNQDEPDSWEDLASVEIDEHDRRDGAVALVAKAATLLMDRA